jgi:protein TonB
VRDLVFHPLDLSFDEDAPRLHPAEPKEELVCDATVGAAAMTTACARRPRRMQAASILSFAIALAVHAGVIALGLIYYKSVSQYQPPQIVLPRGWASEVDGIADAGAPPLLLQPAPPLDLRPPDAPPAVSTILAPPPADFEAPPVAPPTIDAARGTADFGPLPTLGSSTVAPLVNFNEPPGIGAEPTTAAAPERSSIAQTAGSSATGAGTADGGAPQGVPDGLPIPSVRNKKPDYPEIAQRRGWTGTVYLELDLDDRGQVTSARLLQSSGYALLDDAALDAARTWRYTPATLNGQPVAVTVPVPIVYDLQSRRR